MLSSGLLAQPGIFQPHSHNQLSFQPNQGQWEGGFSHVMHTPRYAAFLLNDGFKIGMSPSEALQTHHDSAHAYMDEMPAVPVFGFSWKFIGANPMASIASSGYAKMTRN
jgi:hypothetical protein